MDLVYWPTKVVVVDDDVNILEMLKLYLPSKNFTYHFFNNPFDALEFIKTAPKHDMDQFISFVDEITEYEHKLIDVNICDLHKLAYDHTRFDKVCTLLVDYDMGGMNGIELCQEVDKYGKFNKIMLTSHMGHHQAIQAFNSNIIDQFIEKIPSAQLFKTIDLIIGQLQRKRFDHSTNAIATALTKNVEPSVIKEQGFREYFLYLIKLYNISEYYLLNSAGSYLMVSFNGDIYYLIVCAEEYINSLIELSDNNLPDSVRNQLINKTHIPYFHDHLLHNWPNFQDWESYMYPIEKIIESNQRFYLASVKTKKMTNNIIPFSDYLKSHNSKILT